MPVLSRDWKWDVPECSGREISWTFLGNIWFPGNGIRERHSGTQTSTTFNYLPKMFCVALFYNWNLEGSLVKLSYNIKSWFKSNNIGTLYILWKVGVEQDL